MGKARAQQFIQTRTLHRRRRPRGARDRTRLRRCHAVLSHRRRTALPPPRQTPQRRRFSPPKQQQQLWQRIFASLVRAAASSQSGGRLPRGPGGRAGCDRGRGGLARAGAAWRRAGKAACKGGAIGEAAALAPVQLTRQPPVPSGGLCAAGLSIHTSDDLPHTGFSATSMCTFDLNALWVFWGAVKTARPGRTGPGPKRQSPRSHPHPLPPAPHCAKSGPGPLCCTRVQAAGGRVPRGKSRTTAPLARRRGAFTPRIPCAAALPLRVPVGAS